MKWIQKYFSILVWIVLISCGGDDKLEEEIAKIPLDLRIERFDREFAQASPSTIPELKSKYPYLFPKQFSDSVWISKLNDTIQQELFSEVDRTFGDFKKQEMELISLFRHIRYYFPNYKVPKVVTLTSEVQYDNRVVLTDSLLLLALDNYLGPEHHFYGGISKYISKNLAAHYLTSDIVSAFAKTINRYPRNRTFLSRMVYHGKELYLKDKLIPKASDAQKLNYTEDEIIWAKENEEQIWRYFVEHELLYSTDSKLDQRFLDPAPFSKFGLDLDNETPGRLGHYMGWQIVRAYMHKNPVALTELFDVTAGEILKQSNYKPKK